jgi:TRAP-type transport system periplasmic protein
MKPVIRNLLSAAAVTAMMASGSALAATKMRLSCPSAANNPTCVPAYVFAKEVERLTKGSVTIQVFPSGQLGKGKEAIQQMQAGIIDLTVESIGRYSAFVKDLNVFTWGFTFRDEDHFNKFLYSPTGNAMFEEMDKKHGIVFLSRNWRKLPRVVVSSKPVFSPDDLTGLKFRVPSIPTYIKTWQTLGANPTQVPWADAFQALKTGVVDGMEAPFDSVLAQKFHLAVPYVTMTNHLFTAQTLSVNAKKFYGLSKDEQAAFRKAADAATAKSIELAKDSATNVADKMVADGAFVIRLKPTAFQKKLQAAARKQEAEGLWSKGLIDMIGKM